MLYILFDDCHAIYVPFKPVISTFYMDIQMSSQKSIPALSFHNVFHVYQYKTVHTCIVIY